MVKNKVYTITVCFQLVFSKFVLMSVVDYLEKYFVN